MTQQWFDLHSRSFDRRYAHPRVARALGRAGPHDGLRLAAEIVRAQPGASVLDVGCGPGRVGEAVLTAGASSYVGVDLSPSMLALARARLAPFDHVELVDGDFVELALPRTFDVVLALGLFDYVADAPRAATWLRGHCRSCLVASFTRRDRVKAPVRHAWYAHSGYRVFDFEESEARELLHRAGFTAIVVRGRSTRGFRLTACP